MPSTTRTGGTAEVRGAGRVVRYRRLGEGPRVLLLAPPGDAAEPWPGLLDRLARRHCLLVPELPADRRDLAGCLPVLLDGLGASGLAVIAVGMPGIAALELVLRDADRITHLVLVPDGAGDESVLEGSVASAFGGAPVPLLIVRAGTPADEATARLDGFLAGGASAAPHDAGSGAGGRVPVPRG